MSERPFMQLYVSDFVGDTLLLSTEHIGAYLLLLIALWNADGELPADDVKLARVARLTVKKWRTVSVDLLPFFQVQHGMLTHHRLTKELRKSKAQSNSRALAGAKGGAANALKYNKPTEANASAGLKHASTSPEPYRKKGNQGSVGASADGLVDVNRNIDRDLFAACVALTGPVPGFLEHKHFTVDIVAQAKAQLAAAPGSDEVH